MGNRGDSPVGTVPSIPSIPQPVPIDVKSQTVDGEYFGDLKTNVLESNVPRQFVEIPALNAHGFGFRFEREVVLVDGRGFFAQIDHNADFISGNEVKQEFSDIRLEPAPQSRRAPGEAGGYGVGMGREGLPAGRDARVGASETR